MTDTTQAQVRRLTRLSGLLDLKAVTIDGIARLEAEADSARRDLALINRRIERETRGDGGE